MLRSPSEYESTRVELSNRVAKINNLFFDRAIIFFTPKVAAKGVDIANLQCTIVQITDRGEWGKEEETFTVDASSFSNRKYREFDLFTDAEYSLKIIPPPELRMGFLEIYFDPNINLPPMATVNNPSSNIVDMSPVTAAIAASSAAQVAATQAAQAATTRKVITLTESTYTTTAWSGTPTGHVAINPDPARLAIVITNTSNKRVYFDLFTNIANKTSNAQYDTFAEPGATINVEAEESVLGVMLYQIGGNTPATVSIQLES